MLRSGRNGETFENVLSRSNQDRVEQERRLDRRPHPLSCDPLACHQAQREELGEQV